MKFVTLICGLLGLLWFCAAALAGEVKTTVSHIAADALFLNAGRMDSIHVGDRVSVTRDGKLIAYLEVLFVSDRSASCRLLEATGTIAVGDEAMVNTQDTSADSTTIVPIDSVKKESLPQQKSTRRSVKTNRLTGRVTLDSRWSNDLEASNADVAEPSLTGRARLENIGGSKLSLYLKARLRKIIRSRESAAATETQWNNRLYEAALSYDDPTSALSYRAGRFVANAISGIGYLDGALGSYRLSSDWSAGAFLGTNPDLRNTNFQSDQVKSGLFVRFEQKEVNRQKISGTLALAGQYNNGEASREFLYQQFNATPSNTWRFYESTEINLNRGWREQADGSLLISSFLFSTTWNPHKRFTADLGYDNRRNYHTFETRTVADSLFDDAVRQSVRAGVRLSLGQSFFTRAAVGIRGIQSDFSKSGHVNLTVGSNDLLRSRIGSEILYSNYQSTYSRGEQWSLSARRAIHRSLQGSISGGQDRYRITSLDNDVTQEWLRVNGDITITQHYYSSMSAEFRRGENVDGNYYALELGYRF